MEVLQDKIGDVLVFKLIGRLDSNSAPPVEKKIMADVQNGALRLVFDFHGLEYISSAGLRIILKTAKELKRRDGRIAIFNLRDYVLEIFEISGFDTFLPLAADLDDALRKVASAPA